MVLHLLVVHCLAFLWVEVHEPVGLPSLECISVLLEGNSVLSVGNGVVDYGVISKKFNS